MTDGRVTGLEEFVVFHISLLFQWKKKPKDSLFLSWDGPYIPRCQCPLKECFCSGDIKFAGKELVGQTFCCSIMRGRYLNDRSKLQKTVEFNKYFILLNSEKFNEIEWVYFFICILLLFKVLILERSFLALFSRMYDEVEADPQLGTFDPRAESGRQEIV